MNTNDEALSNLLFNALNEQGYLFQEKCAEVLAQNEDTTGWDVKPSEYPISMQGQDAKIDIVLRSKKANDPELYALLECKRADPSYVSWLFGIHTGDLGKSLSKASCRTLVLECREVRSGHPYKVRRMIWDLAFNINTPKAHSWLEVKKGKKEKSSTPQNIEDAFRQVLRGVEGFAKEQLDQRVKCGQQPFKTFFTPVVITTASLYLACYNPSDIDLETGKITRDRVLLGSQGESPQEVQWVLVNYGAGEEVAPVAIPENYYGVDPTDLLPYKTRSVFVVNSKHLVSFFSSLHVVPTDISARGRSNDS